MRESRQHPIQLDGVDCVSNSTLRRCSTSAVVRPGTMDVHLASCVPRRISSQSLQMNLDVWLSLTRQSADQTYPLWPRPCAHTQRYHRDSSLRLSCNLGRCVTSSFCGSLFSAGVLRDPNAFRPFSRVDCCVQPDIKLGMIVHPFPSLEVQQNLRAIPRHVCPTTFRLGQPANVEYNTMPTTCWFGLHTAPMSENSICR